MHWIPDGRACYNVFMKISFVSDFDGTITDDDFFAYVKDAFFDDTVLKPWHLYLDGELSHFEALKQIYGTLRVSEEELRDLVKKVKIDEWVMPTFELCFNAKIPIYVASAGCDFYINLLIGKEIEKFNITLITNESTYSQASGLFMERPPKESPFYDENVGISKKEIVRVLKEDGYRVIFAGDGPPDIEPAKLSDVVFAKKLLLEKCQKEGISTEVFNDFRNIYSFLEREISG